MTVVAVLTVLESSLPLLLLAVTVLTLRRLESRCAIRSGIRIATGSEQFQRMRLFAYSWKV